MKYNNLLLLLSIIMISMQSCRKDIDTLKETGPDLIPVEQVQGSIMGSVVDDNQQPIADATVLFGNEVTTTDDYGVFQFVDTKLFADGTYIKVKKDGYFIGSRRFYAKVGETSNVRIQLLELSTIASFNSTESKVIEFEGATLDFKENMIETATGEPYNGNVNVAARYLDPTLIETMDRMPGDLSALTVDDDLVSLSSYAMIGVELYDDQGNELQVAEGNSVTTTIPVPNDLLATAPQTIPMWHFDEEVGIWVEEGTASLIDGNYVTSLGHFSFWNCDIPQDYAFIDGVIYNRGVPLEGLLVVIKDPSNTTSGSGRTDANGEYQGFVPANKVLTLEVYNLCGDLIYTTTVGPFSEDTTIDPININIAVDQVNISGSVIGCDVTPSEHTYVLVSQGNLHTPLYVDENLNFEGSVFYCDNSIPLTVSAVDVTTGLASTSQSIDATGDINIGAIQLCNEVIQPHLYLEYGSEVYNYDFNQDSVAISYTIVNISPDQDLYTLTHFNWTSQTSTVSTIVHNHGSEGTSSIEDPSLSFKATGSSTTNVVNQDGTNFLVSTGTLTEIEVYNPSTYDASWTSLYYSIAIRLF